MVALSQSCFLSSNESLLTEKPLKYTWNVSKWLQIFKSGVKDPWGKANVKEIAKQLNNCREDSWSWQHLWIQAYRQRAALGWRYSNGKARWFDEGRHHFGWKAIRWTEAPKVQRSGLEALYIIDLLNNNEFSVFSPEKHDCQYVKCLTYCVPSYIYSFHRSIEYLSCATPH